MNPAAPVYFNLARTSKRVCLSMLCCVFLLHAPMAASSEMSTRDQWRLICGAAQEWKRMRDLTDQSISQLKTQLAKLQQEFEKNYADEDDSDYYRHRIENIDLQLNDAYRDRSIWDERYEKQKPECESVRNRFATELAALILRGEIKTGPTPERQDATQRDRDQPKTPPTPAPQTQTQRTPQHKKAFSDLQRTLNRLAPVVNKGPPVH